MPASYDIAPIATPEHLMHPQKEVNLLWYGPSQLLGAFDSNKHLVGVIRIAERIKTPLAHGLITDLHIDADTIESPRAKEIGHALILGAQNALLKKNSTKIDAVVIDGSKLAQHFIDTGFWASRKMVVIQWDLAHVKLPPAVDGVTISLETTLDSNEVTDFIISSYQPYWRWWKNDAFDRLWERIDYPAHTPDQVETENAEHNREHIMTLLEDGVANALTGNQIFAVARKDGRIIGLCDAKVVGDPLEDCSDWGVLMLREHPGKGFGQLLLLSCLNWLKSKRVQTATITTTSGLDDFDPTVYLYVQACGGKIKGEFNNFVKRKF